MASTSSSQFPSRVLLPLILLLLAAASDHRTPRAYAATLPITRPGCPDKCGDVLIPFPFGIGSGCFLQGFEVTCNTTFTPPRAFITNREIDDPTAIWPYTGVFQDVLEEVYLAGSDVYSEPSSRKNMSVPLELFSITVADNQARGYGAISSDCSTDTTDHLYKYQGTVFDRDGPNGTFLLSATSNVVVGVGNNAEPLLSQVVGDTTGFWVSCVAKEDGYLMLTTNGSCTGHGCCQAPVPPEAEPRSRSTFSVALYPRNNTRRDVYPCSYGMLVEESWYNFSTPDTGGYETLPKKFPRGVPFVFDFAIRNGTCPAEGQRPPADHACVSDNSYCATATNGQGYVCKCSQNYEGNPYIKNGCQDIDECEDPVKYPCQGTCKNKPGDYDCLCKAGMKGDAKKGNCTEKFPTVAKAVVGAIGGLFLIALLSFLVLLRKEKRKTKEFYAKNGGPTLEKAKIIKIFKRGALKHILKSSNVIGKGGFGEVYKGTVGDEIVAIKKPINGSILENEQFANEVIIQSQVIHRNIVRLIGCCLDVDIPMLVYEFLSRGSLDDILHSNNMGPLNLDERLRIAAESADGLAYMHSKTSTKILHGDVKPANILLDDNLLPKISDFGISRLIPRDKEHAASVIGDMSYMDPVYLQTGLLTEKSDVYSFGVVLLELISRKKATHSDNYKLVNSYLEDHKNGKKSTALFDKDIAEESNLEILDSVAGLAVECLNLDVDKRPAMTEVAHRLLMLYQSRLS
nr:wall-associated receptor kinase 1-like [Lolium perenne]